MVDVEGVFPAIQSVENGCSQLSVAVFGGGVEYFDADP